jgi:hypothetical protein
MSHVSFRRGVVLCLFLSVACAMSSSEAQRVRTRVLLDTDANNEVDDQHAIAYMLFSGDAFDVVGITVNRTRGGGDVEQHAKEAERIVKLAGLERRFAVTRGVNGSFDEVVRHLDESTFDGSAAVDLIIRRAHEPSAQRLVLLPVVVGRNGGRFTTFGDYSIDLFEHINLQGNTSWRALFDMAAVAIVKNPAWAHAVRIPAPRLVGGKWVARPNNPRRITLWENFDRDAIMKDFFASMDRPVLAR